MNYQIRGLRSKVFSDNFEFEIDGVVRDKILKLLGYDSFDIWFLNTFNRESIITTLKHKIRRKIAWIRWRETIMNEENDDE